MYKIMDVLNVVDTSHTMFAVGGVVVTVVSVFALRKMIIRKGKGKKGHAGYFNEDINESKNEYPRGTVILHQVGRAPYAPSMTPFAVKLETYLRMAKIPYQNVHGMQKSSKGKFPWIEFNGQEVADTSLCIEFLNKKLAVDLNRNLSPADRGVAQAMQAMVEEHLYWFLVLFRWKFDKDVSFLSNAFNFKFGRLTMSLYRRHLNKQTWNQGLGRHTEGEVTEMFQKDLQSLSDFIGMKKFLMGDEPCETDCAVFGQLSQFYWQFLGTGHERTMKDKYPNLAAYCERMKETFWPDWDQCITHGGTREATK